MPWNPDILSQGEIHALREAAERAWGDDTRQAAYAGSPKPSAGQCYNTSRWLQERLGGSIGRVDGHYVWTSPDGSHVLDLTGDQFGNDAILYKQASHPLFEGVEPVDTSVLDDDSTHRMISRANREYDSLGSKEAALIHKHADLIGDSHPAQEPQATADREQRYFHHAPSAEESKGEYKFIFANNQLEVSPFHDHKDLAEQAGVDLSDSGPIAVGYISVDLGMANFSVASNVGAKAISRVLRDYADRVGWKWGGMTDLEGEPVGQGSEFAPKNTKTMRWHYANGHLYIGERHDDLLRQAFSRTGSVSPENNIFGACDVIDCRVVLTSLSKGSNVFFSTTAAKQQLEGFVAAMRSWAEDQGLTLTATGIGGGDNVIKRHEDLEIDNIYTPTPQNMDEHQFFPRVDERQPGGVFKCEHCGRISPTWRDYRAHALEHEPPGEEARENGGFPENDMDATHPTHFTEQQPAVFPVASVADARRAPGFTVRANAFGFDNDDHRHYVAHQYGCAVGWMSVDPEGAVQGIYSVVHPRWVARLLTHEAQKHYATLTWDERVDIPERYLKDAGFVRSARNQWKYAAGKDPKDLVEDDVPFIYDVQDDNIYIGHPGTKTADIPGKFTPGGIVEGTYEPGGKVYIRSMTNMPYTVRHMIQLWYAQHPHLEVKGVHLRDDSGSDTKLAAQETDPVSTVLLKVAEDPAATLAKNALHQAGARVFVVGGAVRDAVMGKEPKDIDLMVQGVPAEDVQATLEKLPGRVDYTGKDFGVFRYKTSGNEVEIALPRRERSTGDSHKDFDVQADHTMEPEQDLYRRDFTANAMAIDLATGELLDPYRGAEDIANGNLRTVHEHALAEDPLRVVRALVAHGKHGLHPDEHTRAQMTSNSESLQHLPQERIQAELDKLMSSAKPADAIRLAHETGALKHILPEVDAAFGYNQNNPHHELELGEHLLNVLERTAEQTDDPDLRLAALLHDIGKPASAWEDPETGMNHFYRSPEGKGANHEEVGAEMAALRLEQLRYPKDRAKRITELVGHHMFPAFTTPRGARRFLNNVGDHADDLLTLRQADQGGKSEYPTDPEISVDDHRRLIHHVQQEQSPTQLSQLAITGKDLIDAGMKPGPELGATLQRLLEATLEDPSLNNRETLLSMV